MEEAGLIAPGATEDRTQQKASQINRKQRKPKKEKEAAAEIDDENNEEEEVKEEVKVKENTPKPE